MIEESWESADSLGIDSVVKFRSICDSELEQIYIKEWLNVCRAKFQCFVGDPSHDLQLSSLSSQDEFVIISPQ